MTNAVDIGLYIPVTSTAANLLNTKRIFPSIGITNNTLLPTTEPVKKFTSASTVGDFFGTSSDEYVRAVRYFKTSTQSATLPPYLYFGKWINTALSPYVLSSVILTTSTRLLELKAVTAGNFTMSINGTAFTTTAIDLSTATSLSDAATKLVTKMKADNATIPASFNITYSGVTNKFTASLTETGSLVTLSFATSTLSGGLADLFQLSEVKGAILSQGSDVLTTANNLNYLKNNFTDQYALIFVNDLNGALTNIVKLDVATWVSEQPTLSYAFFCWSDEIAITQTNDTTSINYLITQNKLSNTAIFAGNTGKEKIINTAFAAGGIFASVDLSTANSAMTLAWKSQDGLLPTVTDTEIAKILFDKNVNYYNEAKLSGGNTVFDFFMTGGISGSWKFIDNQMAQIYISSQIQGDLAQLFTSTPQAASDSDGLSQIRATIGSSMEKVVATKLLSKGLTFSNVTAQSVQSTYGVSILELTLNGYIIKNDLPTEVQRQLRTSSTWYVLYVKGSAINVLPINTSTYY